MQQRPRQRELLLHPLGELRHPVGSLGSYGFDLDDPTATDSVNRIGDDLNVPLTHEVVVGVDRELLPEFGLSAALTWRCFSDLRWTPIIGVRRGDFVEAGRVAGTLPSAGRSSSIDVPYFAPNPGVLPRGNGWEDINREGYHQRYWGFEVDARKRMSNRWMARIGFSVNDHREYFDDPNLSIEGPTPLARNGKTGTASNPLKNGRLMFTRSEKSGKEDFFFVLPKYQFIANGLVQGPWGINVACNLLILNGLSQPFYADTLTGDPSSPRKFVLVTFGCWGSPPAGRQVVRPPVLEGGPVRREKCRFRRGLVQRGQREHGSQTVVRDHQCGGADRARPNVGDHESQRPSVRPPVRLLAR